MSNSLLDTPIEYLKGVGPQKADILKKQLGIQTYHDLLYYFPFRYIDRTKFYHVNEISEDLPYVQLKGKLVSAETVGEMKTKRLVATFTDGTASLELVWFQGHKWIKDTLRFNEDCIIFGKPTLYKSHYNIAHPELEYSKESNPLLNSSLQAMYSSNEHTKKRGMDSKGIMKLQRTLLPLIHNNIPENLSTQIIEKVKLISREEALTSIHIPSGIEALKKAELRLKFEELFFLQLKMQKIKSTRNATVKGSICATVGDKFNSFYKQYLPFELTGAQKRVIKEIRIDMGSGKQMNRMLQGDVGSGKTLVALMVMLIAIDNKLQACMMAPTEILANQHYETLLPLLTPLGLNVALLTGSSKAKQRREIHEKLESGELHILIGTHALIEDKVKFNNLGLVVIDEQHRFGVQQRYKLWAKNTTPPHVLVMTATPIPRTLAMTLYGDLDISVIDEMPPGRKPIITTHRYDSSRLAVFGFMRQQIKLGRQVYVVYPLIKESEKMDYKNLMDGFFNIQRDFPLPEYNVSIVHGQMKAADKDYEMQRFVKKQAQIMVATTVIEVGVNIPNASIMVIESAERFGLSQLHQLRGRVGRGADQSYCILMTSNKLGNDSKTRLETMVRTNDGFEIAETDLRLRGPGDIAGTQQSGVLDLKLADLSKDSPLVQLSRDVAQKIMEEDPTLVQPINKPLADHLLTLNKEKTNWSKVS